jgi:hypothetical protein
MALIAIAIVNIRAIYFYKLFIVFKSDLNKT